MAFELPDLPYAHDALAGLSMSAETLEYHHDLHHKAICCASRNARLGPHALPNLPAHASQHA